MRLSFDPAKNERNIQQRGLDFSLVADFEWATAVMVEDLRKDYGERRFLALGRIGVRLHALVFTPRAESLHVISLRKANTRELKHYEKTPRP